MASRIRFDAKQAMSTGSVQLFVTLDYSDECVPYAKISDLVGLRPDTTFVSVPIYRDSHFKRGFSRVDMVPGPTLLKSLDVPFFGSFHENYFKTYSLKVNKRHDNKRVGLIYYKDVQDFEKRLRTNISRAGLKSKIRCFKTAEYGATTFRPHFHLAVTCRVDEQAQIASLIRKSWPLCHWHVSDKRIQVARNVGKYIASYVNKSAEFPGFLSVLAPPQHSFSRFYGYDSDRFSYARLSKMVDKGDLRLPIMFDELCGNYSLRLVPAHVMYRYWPKFKGLSRLSDAEVYDVCRCPARLHRYAERLDYSREDIKDNISRLRRGFTRCLAASPYPDLTYMDWANQYLLAWNVFRRNILSDWYTQQELGELDIQNSFDNLPDLSRPNARARCAPWSSNCLTDAQLLPANMLPYHVTSSARLADEFHHKIKQRKVNEHIYSRLSNNEKTMT